MELYFRVVYPYLILNEDQSINHGCGYFIKPGTPKEKIEKIREYHNWKLNRGEPYCILDFLFEDYERAPESILETPLGYYPKRKVPDGAENVVLDLSPLENDETEPLL